MQATLQLKERQLKTQNNMAETLLEKAQRLGIKPTGKPAVQQPTMQTTNSGAIQSTNVPPTVQQPQAPQEETLLQKAQRLGIKPTNAPAQTPIIPNVKETGKQKIARLQMEADAAKAKSDKLNSGFEQYVRPVADAVLPGVSNLGDTVSGIVNTNLQGPEIEQQLQQLDNLQNSILRQIKDRHAKGKDATDLEQEYNSTSRLMDNLRGQFKESTKGADKTTGQVSGELLSTGLNVLSAGTYSRATGGAPTLVNETQQALKTATPLLSKETGKAIAKGVATAAPVAYGYDVAAGLQGERGQDRTGANAFIPGLTTAIGATVGGAIPALSAAENSYKTFQAARKVAKENKLQSSLVNKVADDIFNVETKYAKGRKMQLYEKDGGAASRERIAQSNVLDGHVDENGVLRTQTPGGPVDQYKMMTIDGTEGYIRNELVNEGKSVPLSLVRQKLVNDVRQSGLHGDDLLTALSKINREIEGYKIAAGIADNVPIEEASVPLYLVHDAKVGNYNNINFQTPPDVKTYRKTVAKALKEIVEKQSDVKDIKKFNEEIGVYLKDIDRLKSLDGARVEGGRLAKYTAQIAGNIIGATAGSMFGPAGSTVGGIIGGEVASKIKSAGMQKTFSTGGAAPTLQKSKIIEQAAKRNADLKLKKPLQLNAPTN